MNPRSLRFRLLAWFAGLLVLVVVLFGFYTYRRIEGFVVEVQRSALAHRAEQIAAMLQAAPRGDDTAVGSQVAARFAPELNDKFVRVTRPGGALLYVPGLPNDPSFDPATVPPFPPALVASGVWRYPAAKHSDLLVSALPVTAGA